MSAKQTVETIKTDMGNLSKTAEKHSKSAEAFDRELASKIRKVQESSQEVVKHIEQRQEK